jgi:hypothetical protein
MFPDGHSVTACNAGAVPAALDARRRTLTEWCRSHARPRRMSDAIIASLADQRNAILDRLKALLRIPSVSTDPAFAPHMRAARDLLLQRLRDGGMQNAQLLDGGGQPARCSANDLARQASRC